MAKPLPPHPNVHKCTHIKVTDSNADRQKNAAYGASRGTEPKNNPAPKEQKNPRDPSSHKVENSKEYERIQQAEAAVPGKGRKLARSPRRLRVRRNQRTEQGSPGNSRA
jgi:hypothetical protein